RSRFGFIPDTLNLGGGFGIRYTKNDCPLPYSKYVEDLVTKVDTCAKAIDIPVPEISIAFAQVSTFVTKSSTYLLYGRGQSFFVYRIPKPPPKFNVSGINPKRAFHSANLEKRTSAAFKKPLVSNICEPI